MIFPFGEVNDCLLVMCRSYLLIFGVGPEPEFHRAHQPSRLERVSSLPYTFPSDITNLLN